MTGIVSFNGKNEIFYKILVQLNIGIVVIFWNLSSLLTHYRQFLSQGDGVKIWKLVADFAPINSSALKTDSVQLNVGGAAQTFLELQRYFIRMNYWKRDLTSTLTPGTLNTSTLLSMLGMNLKNSCPSLYHLTLYSLLCSRS